jgi:hypothetical protein
VEDGSSTGLPVYSSLRIIPGFSFTCWYNFWDGYLEKVKKRHRNLDGHPRNCLERGRIKRGCIVRNRTKLRERQSRIKVCLLFPITLTTRTIRHDYDRTEEQMENKCRFFFQIKKM